MKIDKESPIPLYIQIRENFRLQIQTGTLTPGDRMSTVSDYAKKLKVTPTTIRRAFQDLANEGLIASHVGRGTFVLEQSNFNALSPETSKPFAEPTSAKSNQIPSSLLRDSLGRNLSDLMTLSHKPSVIAFTRGIGDPEIIEKGILTRLAARALESGEELFWDHGDPRGLPSLREEIANLYREQDLDINPDHILVTSGSQQAIALLAQQATDTAITLVCETPCYSGVTNAFHAFGTNALSLPEAPQAPDITTLPPHSHPTMLYLCPVLHNPTGTDLGQDEQQAIIRWAHETNSVILADEVYRDLHPDSPAEKCAPRSFLADPGPEKAIILGSLSKSFISGLRVGWIVSSRERIETLTTVKKAMDLGCPPLMQGIAREFLADPQGYRAHRERIREHYRILRDRALAALSEFMPSGVTWTHPAGGFQLQLTLPEGYSSVELYLRSIERGAAFLPGPLQDINLGFLNTCRLCYGSLNEIEIREGIKRIAQATREYIDEPRGPASPIGFGDF